ncbi:MAG: HAD family phosphatase [Spirochaetaceae bacterium]|jgi:HAD superfamily hydrolase (TIGR01509 family)|nr:HAD family phosphatase [Spirochaetaceae bacterium]
MADKPPFLVEAAIFDMDGLMLDTEGPAVFTWMRIARSMGLAVDMETALKTVGLDEPSTIAIIREAYGPDFPLDHVRQEWERVIALDADKNGIPCRPGLITLLDHLADLGIPLGVATSSSREAALWKLERGGILERFPVLACGNEVRRGKPAPDIFLLAAERLGRDPAGCVGFEDSPAGLRGLHAAGIRSIFVKDLVEPPEEVLRTVWRRYDNLAEAAPLFGPAQGR